MRPSLVSAAFGIGHGTHQQRSQHHQERSTCEQLYRALFIDGKTALVTGASKGIGLEACAVLADAGADIAAVARDRTGLAEAAKKV